ncbi:MAG: hypothetical protein HY860_06040 [Chlamydiales bacterium]|nr:hypothetical protein [Chlamydiales bacterium]
MGIRAIQHINQSPDASGGPSSQTIQQVTFDLQQMYNFMSMGNANNWDDPNTGIAANFWAYFSDILSISNPGFTKAQQQALETVDSYFGNMPNPPTPSDYGQLLSDIQNVLQTFGGSIPSSNPWLNIISVVTSCSNEIIAAFQAMQNDVNQQNWVKLSQDAEQAMTAAGYLGSSIAAIMGNCELPSGIPIPFLSDLSILTSGVTLSNIAFYASSVYTNAEILAANNEPWYNQAALNQVSNGIGNLSTLVPNFQQLLAKYGEPS